MHHRDPRFPPIPDPLSPFPTEAPASGTPLLDLVGWWLSAKCVCDRVTHLPFRLLAAQLGWETPLSAVLPRLRCEKCQSRPAIVEIVDNPARRRQDAQRAVRVW